MRCKNFICNYSLIIYLHLNSKIIYISLELRNFLVIFNRIFSDFLFTKNSIFLKTLTGKGRNVRECFDSSVSFFYFTQVRSDGTAIKMENFNLKKIQDHRLYGVATIEPRFLV